MRFKNLSKVTWLEGQSLSGPVSKLIPLCHPAQLPVEALASHMHAQSLRLLGCKTGVTGSAVASAGHSGAQAHVPTSVALGRASRKVFSGAGGEGIWALLYLLALSCKKKKNEALDFKFLKDP